MAVDDSVHDMIRSLIDRLKHPIPDLSLLLTLLTGPLDILGLLPPRFARHNTQPLSLALADLLKHIPSFQDAILEHIVPTWDGVLSEGDQLSLVEQYFCPDAFSFANPNTGEIVLFAYSTILSRPLTDFSIGLLARLSSEYSIDKLYTIAHSGHGISGAKRNAKWEDCVRDVMAVPTRVANALEGKKSPATLEYGRYMNAVCARCECLLYDLSKKKARDSIQPLLYLFTKLVNIGAFPATQPVSRSQPSFFQSTLHIIESRLDGSEPRYAEFWHTLFASFGSSLTLQSILTSLLGSISPVRPTDPTPKERALAKSMGLLLFNLVGPLSPEQEELWETAFGVILSRNWGEGYARIFVCWVCASHNGKVDEKALEQVLDRVLDAWSSPEHVKHSLLSRHHYTTALLLLTIASFPPAAQTPKSLAISPAFVTGVGAYISHNDPSVRRCGMLVAEVIAQRAGKKLDFGDWDGESEGRLWAREMRALIKGSDSNADLGVLREEAQDPLLVGPDQGAPTTASETQDQSSPQDAANLVPRAPFAPISTGYDSDDSLVGYASPPSSSRSVSPTPAELEEMEKDPTINVGRRKVPRPVYLAQVGTLLRGTAGPQDPQEPHEADKLEMGLNCAEELIRRKVGYGTELEENAVNLAYGLLSLQNNFELEGFEDKRLNALSALVACGPRRAAPAIIEEYFKNQYSTSQRFTALNALAFGARELAGMPIAPSSQELKAFPSKMLPPALHQKYLTAGQEAVPMLMNSISRQAIDRGKEATADKVPEYTRERHLRVQQPRRITEVVGKPVLPSGLVPQRKPVVKYTEVATEYFIMPLINRFWLFLRDEQSREERTAHQEGRFKYHGAGAGLVLNPSILSHFFATLAVLVHTAQNAPEWLSIIAPDSLELAVTIGTRPVSHMDDGSPENSAGQPEERQRKEASVLTASLELALVVLDGCIERDGGRVLALEHTPLVLGVGEWAKTVFSLIEKGVKVPGGGGAHEVKLSRAAAGVLLKIDELTSKWKRSMIEL
ncbi:hypothetical protein BDN72DRAFT_792148 [Pluteus cervinus]|uniref:Uncharacterized protein n=1 Tax=Pluteus cervinus TaxID=181527 RepID=A0ACD3B380_9AGAR|nr:hypothetical protein BDN72DRAFT_792148 [Pluteus cervinus]